MDIDIADSTLSIEDHRIEDAIEEKLEAYLAGERIIFDEAVDLSGLTDFQQRVLNAIRQVAYGETITYAGLAERIGKPTAVRASQSSPAEMTCSSTSPLLARAVANACGSNPVPIVIPCHRVVAKDGMGGYSDGGVVVKEALLRLEGADI